MIIRWLAREWANRNPQKYIIKRIQHRTRAENIHSTWQPAQGGVVVQAIFADGKSAEVTQPFAINSFQPWKVAHLNTVADHIAETIMTVKDQRKERQTGDLSRVRVDHLNRYMYAKDLAKSPVLDAACGTGYGSFILAEHGHTVTAIDIEKEAIDAGKEGYAHGNIEWIVGSIYDKPWGEHKYNTIISFETLEHLERPLGALLLFRDSLEPGGKLICSVPNEEQYQFNAEDFAQDKYPHQRHYTPRDFESLLDEAGFTVIHRGTQLSKVGTVVNGSGGKFLVYTCEVPAVATA